MAKRFGEHSDDDFYLLMFKGRHEAEDAFAEIYSRYSSKVFTFCKYYLGSYDEACDVFQETFIKFHNSKSPDKVMTNMIGYLLRIARNLCINVKRDNKQEAHYQEYFDFIASSDDNATPTDSEKLGKIIREALEYLSESYREIFILREYDGLTYQEIAEVLGEPMETVKVRLYRAKQQMRKLLKPQLEKLEIK